MTNYSVSDVIVDVHIFILLSVFYILFLHE